MLLLSLSFQSFSPESSEGNTLSIFTDIGDSPSRSSLNSKTDSNVDEHSLPCSPKQVSVTGESLLAMHSCLPNTGQLQLKSNNYVLITITLLGIQLQFLYYYMEM